jgi:hypothetical protein
LVEEVGDAVIDDLDDAVEPRGQVLCKQVLPTDGDFSGEVCTWVLVARIDFLLNLSICDVLFHFITRPSEYALGLLEAPSPAKPILAIMVENCGTTRCNRLGSSHARPSPASV